MSTLLNDLTAAVAAIFVDLGGSPQLGRVEISDRPELGQFQCNGAMAAARELHRPPRQIADEVAERLREDTRIAEVSIAGPGFINITLSNDFLVERIRAAASDKRLGCPPIEGVGRVILDFGGLNVAKAMHVGHLRSLIIGDCLQRLLKFLGADVISDIHLGDWELRLDAVRDVTHFVGRRASQT